MPKLDPDLLERMEGLLGTLPAKRRSMFGTVSWFANSNEQMFTGIWGDRVNARVGEDAVAELVGTGEADAFEPMSGRPMKEYVLLPAQTTSDDPALQSWVERALAFAEDLPPKRR
jgi:TfoX/Sxy family transcriptional regulator of competence genes